MTVALNCKEYDLALHGMDALIDLGVRRADGEGRQVDPRALIHVVNGVLQRVQDSNDDFAKRLCDRLERFFAKIKVGFFISHVKAFSRCFLR